eukprot:GSMAST32.ASY1.ANO1.2476.1 assembled CDS
MALHWFLSRNPLSIDIDPKLIDKIPGSLSDRKTPFGELNWIFTSITDTIAWNVLPLPLFQRLFPERIMGSLHCTPVSRPKLPSTAAHHLWQSWDLAVEQCLAQLSALLSPKEEKTSTAAGPPVEELKLQKNSLQNDNNKSEPISKAAMAAFKHSSFFEEQLTAFQVWLRFGDVQNKSFYLGRWAVNLALSVGIHPYVLKLLLSPAVELRPILVFIWARIIDLDLSCQDDLLKNGGHMYFVSQLAQNSRHSIMYGNSPKMSMDAISMIYAQRKWMAAYVLALLMHDNHVGQKQCLEARFHLVAGDNLTSNDSMLRQWLCLALAKQWHNYDDARWIATKDNTVDRLFPLLDDDVPEVRGAAALAVGELLDKLGVIDDIVGDIDNIDMVRADLLLVTKLLPLYNDCSLVPRREMLLAVARLVVDPRHSPYIQVVALALAEEKRRQRTEMQLTDGENSRRPSEDVTDDDMGSMADTAAAYLAIWQVVRDMYRRDPAPLVQRIAATLVKHVNTEMVEKGTKYVRVSGSASADNLAFSPQRVEQSGKNKKKDASVNNHGNVDNSNGGNSNGVRRQVKTTLLELRLRSTIFEWSMARFGKSLLTPTSNGSDPISREGAALRYRRRRHAKVSSMCNATPEIKKFVQSAILDNESEMSSVLLFHPYETCLVVANVKDEIRLWNYDAGEKMGQFSNQNRGPSRVTSLLWVNPNDDSLLMVGSDDGMVRSWHHPSSCGDGSIRIIDKRSPSECAVTATMREHKHWVVNVHKQLGSDQHLISASVAGDVKLWDMRRSATSIQTIRAHKPGAPCTAFISHDYAPVLASGSHKQFIRVFKTDGETISTIRYHDGFLGQRIGPVACLAFHPNEMFLAAGATDSIISIYSSNKKS